MNIMEMKTKKTFENLRKVNEFEQEFWYARELQEVLEYKEWRNFLGAVEKAKIACETSGNAVSDHFVDANKMVGLGSGSEREITDIMLSRYACYLTVQNGDPRSLLSRRRILAFSKIVAIKAYMAAIRRRTSTSENA